MGLEAFKTDKPRKKSKRSSKDNIPDKHTIHVTNDIDLEEVNIPGRIKRHDVKYLEIVTPDGEGEGNVICNCMQCATVATSYEAIVKANHLNFQDAVWYDKFKEVALRQAPDKPTGNMQDSDESEDDESDSGLMAFKS